MTKDNNKSETENIDKNPLTQKKNRNNPRGFIYTGPSKMEKEKKDFILFPYQDEIGGDLADYYGIIGIIFVDYHGSNENQIDDKNHYLIEDIQLFDCKSAKYIHFFLPGYTYSSENAVKVDNVIHDGKQLYFNQELFKECVDRYKKKFEKLKYKTDLKKPTLILHECKEQKLSSEYIVFDLKYTKAAETLDLIINLAKKNTDISEMSLPLLMQRLSYKFPELAEELIKDHIIFGEPLLKILKEIENFQTNKKSSLGS